MVDELEEIFEGESSMIHTQIGYLSAVDVQHLRFRFDRFDVGVRVMVRFRA